jgi:PTS system nitrogen regulatory IIA component
MLPSNLISENRVRVRVDVQSKKRLLESLAAPLAAAFPGLDADGVFDRLNERERLGSTGLGHGVALPHARVREIDEAIGAFVQLREGVAFDAVDNRPVDLAFGLLVPEAATEQHLELLSKLATMFNDPALRQALRDCSAPHQVLELLNGRPGQVPDT